LATELKSNITLSELLEIIEDDYVLSKRRESYHYKDKTSKYDSNIVQIYKNKEENKIYLQNFDSYGNKMDLHTIKPVSIEELLVLYTGKNKIFKHKKRISKKSKDNSIVDETDSKKLIYEWLLKKHTEAIIIPEVTLGDRRVDYLALDKNITSIEIKSEVDTVERLEEQIKQYLLYSNYVYIAAHTSKIEKIKKMDIPDIVGLIEITSTKLKFLKRAKKQKVDYVVFKSFISYNEYLEMKRGFKGSSKIEKMDIELLFEKILSKKQQSEYIAYIMKSRYLQEDKIRRDKYKSGEILAALGSAKGIGINRMSNIVNIRGLKHYFDLPEESINTYLNKSKNQVLRAYKGFKYIELILEDRMFYLKVLKLLDIPYTHENSKILKYEVLKEQAKIILSNQSLITKSLEEEKKKLLKMIKEDVLVLDCRTKESMEYAELFLKENEITYTDIKIKSNILNIPEDIKKSNQVLLLLNKTSTFYFLKDTKKEYLFTFN